MKNKIFSIAFAFFVFVFLVGSVSAKCWSYDDNEDGIIDYKWYSIDPTFITKAEVKFDGQYIKDTWSQRGFYPSEPFSPLDTIVIEYETSDVHLPDCYEGYDDTTDENGNPIQVYNPWKYFGGWSPTQWEVDLLDSSGLVLGSKPYYSHYDMITSNIDETGKYQNVKYKGKIMIKLDSWVRYCNNVYGCPWPEDNIALGIIGDPTSSDPQASVDLFNQFVDAVDSGGVSFLISSKYQIGNDYVEADLATPVDIQVSNCVRGFGSGPIKVVTAHKNTPNQYISDSESNYGVSHWDLTGLVKTNFLYTDPYLQNADKFSFYTYLGDDSKRMSGKCAGAKYVVLGVDQYGSEEKVEGDTAYVPLEGYGLGDPNLARKYVHGFSHVFAKLSDENVAGPVAVSSKGINCISQSSSGAWGIWSNRVWGCGGDNLALSPSETSIMDIRYDDSREHYAPNMDLLNIVSCAYALNGITRQGVSSAVKQCYNGHYIIKPSYPGIPIRFPDGTVAEDYQ